MSRPRITSRTSGAFHALGAVNSPERPPGPTRLSTRPPTTASSGMCGSSRSSSRSEQFPDDGQGLLGREPLAVDANWLRTTGLGSARASSTSSAWIAAETSRRSPSRRTVQNRTAALRCAKQPPGHGVVEPAAGVQCPKGLQGQWSSSLSRAIWRSRGITLWSRRSARIRRARRTYQ